MTVIWYYVHLCVDFLFVHFVFETNTVTMAMNYLLANEALEVAISLDKLNLLC